jgi:CRP-like cAMP-binding protein
MTQLMGTTAQNQLMSALPRATRERLLKRCSTIDLVLNEIVCKAGDRIQHVYFPTSGSISLVAVDESVPLDVGLIGNEGMLGLAVALGISVSAHQVVVHGDGYALRMAARPFLLEVRANLHLRKLLHRYLYVRLVQLARASFCVRFHVVDARVARLLLMTRDRAHRDGFFMTHETLARVLGVRRAGITRAANLLRQRKLIDYDRGDVRVLNVSGLEKAACGCYQADRDAYSRIMAQP